MDSVENDENNQTKTWDNSFVDTLYGLSEFSGSFWGDITASIINNTTSLAEVGTNVIIKNKEAFCKKVTPAFNKSKEKIKEKVPEDYKKFFE